MILSGLGVGGRHFLAVLVSVLAGDLKGRWLGPEPQHGYSACLSFGSGRHEVKDRSSPGGSHCSPYTGEAEARGLF